MTAAQTAADLHAAIAEGLQLFQQVDETRTATRPGPGRWCAREVLGHLIDSAANNHQRFVRAQQGNALTLPGYEQNHWVASQGYQEADWPHLVTLWTHFNLHLADVMDRIPPAAYPVRCAIGGDEPVTLEFVVVDYLRHLRHHMGQIRERLR